jgi:hypothetical protein
MKVLMIQFFGLQLDRGNLSNALTDNFLKDLNLSTNDYNNVLLHSLNSSRRKKETDDVMRAQQSNSSASSPPNSPSSSSPNASASSASCPA